MNTQKIARGWALIAEGAMELSLAYESIDQPAPAGEPLSVPAPAGSAVGLSPGPAAPTQQEQHVNTVLGECPDHQVPWSIKPGGVSNRTNKSFNAFWRCDQSTGDGWCKKRPVKAWQDSHPIQEAA